MTKKLLIVDDSKVSRLIIRTQILAKHPDWQVIEAVTGDEAIVMAEKESPDFCTMDINMPGMLGTDAAEKILAKQAGIKIAIFSANIQEAFQQRSSAMGAVFVAKPVTEKSINQALQHFVGA